MSKTSLGELIDELHELREQRRDLDSQNRELKLRYDEVQEEVLRQLKAQGLDQGRGDRASVSISETVIPNVTDWTKLMTWIKRNQALHLFERRITKSAWMELVEMRKGRPLPGVESYTKETLNLRTR